MTPTTPKATGCYERWIVPPLVGLVCGLPIITAQRRRVVPEAEGVVLEIGIGSGLNLRHYDPGRVRRVIGVDPNPGMLAFGEAKRRKVPFEVELLQQSAESITLDAGIADTAVVTYTLCSVPQVQAALGEVRRILKPGGRVLVCEHGRSRTAWKARWQDRLNPAWRTLAGGCNINRDVERLLLDTGFAIERLETYPLRFVPEIVGFHYVGSARPR
ncbi:MAG: class I SAM-dependent methyltransferase [Hyphomicrobiaceae bacterium]|nr:class I SAM-dependent methyltransferase [Hyphomicrobiaceae bacterium]